MNDKMAPVTPEQKYAIRIIESNLGVKFRGKTKSEAWHFINRYVDESKRISDERVLEWKRKQQEAEAKCVVDIEKLDIDLAFINNLARKVATHIPEHISMTNSGFREYHLAPDQIYLLIQSVLLSSFGEVTNKKLISELGMQSMEALLSDFVRTDMKHLEQAYGDNLTEQDKRDTVSHYKLG